MTFYAFITDKCRQDATKFDLISTLEKQAEKIKIDQKVDNFKVYRAPNFRQKKIGRDYRLMMEEKKITDEKTAICFLAILSKGDFENRNPEQDRDYEAANEEELQKFIKEVDSIDPPKSLPYPNSTEENYLNLMENNIDDSDGMIYESKDWVEAIKSQEMRENFPIIHKLVEAIVWNMFDDVESNKSFKKGENFIAMDGLKLSYVQIPQQNSTLLINIHKDSVEHKEFIKNYDEIINAEDIAKEDIRRISKRAYPIIISADINIWKSVQKDEVANLALSTEEATILNSIVNPIGSNEEKIYPLFINGRPGSGKSTILQYLFAKYLSFHLEKENRDRTSEPPLYLTYSKELLKKSKDSVQSLIQLNTNRLGDTNYTKKISQEFEQLKDKCFGEFHEFLRRLLPESKQKNFLAEYRIDFPKFREIYEEHQRKYIELKIFTPELVWHVIRSYIKGMRDDEGNYFDSDDFKELSENRKSVSQNTFKIVFERVWDNWYKNLCKNDNYWDDQDLTRSLLDSNVDLSKYPVVFCDEAQDFTPIELELILRLSLFSRRNLQEYQLKKVPFAFAGDPFQTLNPTGFDWDAMQAGFHEKIVQELDKSNKANLKFNHRDLEYNYRSNKSIVGFCNLIQLIRGVLFNKPGLKQQRTWSKTDKDDSLPEWFVTIDPDFQKQLSRQRETVIILPCQEGEEDEYINKDDFLKELIRENSNRNILSAMSAKGQEFNRVVLYKFGADIIKNYPQLLERLNAKEATELDREAQLPMEYFINRLYVAASRPKKRLIILDEEVGINKIWNSDILKNFENLVSKYKTSDKNPWGKENLNFVRQGFKLGEEEEYRDDPLDLARNFRNQGEATNDAYLLKLAAINFRLAEGHDKEAHQCEAKRYELEGNLKEAGNEYLQINDSANALHCFWNAGAYEQIIKNHTLQNTAEHRASVFILSEKHFITCKNFLNFLEQEVRSNNRKIITDNRWKETANFLVDEFYKLPENANDWQSVYASLSFLGQNNLAIKSSKNLANLAFRSGNFAEAIKIWESSDIELNKNILYKKAKSATEKYPKNLKYLKDLENKHKEIIEEYESKLETHLSDEDDKQTIFGAYKALGDYKQAFVFLNRYLNKNNLQELLGLVRIADEENLALEIANKLLAHLIFIGEWKESVLLIDNKRWSEADKKKLFSSFIFEIAKSDQLTKAIPTEQQLISDKLEKIWRNVATEKLISLKAIGTAIEKGGRIVAALQFYEDIWKTKKYGTTEDETFAKSRWLVNKYRQIDLKTNTKSSDVVRQRMEADSKASEWEINFKDQPEYLQISNEDFNATIQPQKVDQNLPESEPNLTDEQKILIRSLYEYGTESRQISITLNLKENQVLDFIYKLNQSNKDLNNAE
jgi:hypothetical protein